MHTPIPTCTPVSLVYPTRDGDPSPPAFQAKLLALRVKPQGRHYQPKVCNIIGPKGAVLSAKSNTWDFMTFNICGATRPLLVINLDVYFGAHISRDVALTLFFGEHILGQMNTAIFSGLTPFQAVRGQWAAMNTFQMLLQYPITENVYGRDVLDDTAWSADNEAHILNMGMQTSAQVIEKKYAKLGTEIKASTKVEAHEVSCTLRRPRLRRPHLRRPRQRRPHLRRLTPESNPCTGIQGAQHGVR